MAVGAWGGAAAAVVVVAVVACPAASRARADFQRVVVVFLQWDGLGLFTLLLRFSQLRRMCLRFLLEVGFELYMLLRSR